MSNNALHGLFAFIDKDRTNSKARIPIIVKRRLNWLTAIHNENITETMELARVQPWKIKSFFFCLLKMPQTVR